MAAVDTAQSLPEATGSVVARPHFGGFEALRAAAAVMVVVHHAVALSGEHRAGWLATPAAVMDSGVAIFFVLSGFLIYRPFVVRHLERRPGPGWAAFWWRRVLRIVPAYWVALTFFWGVGAFDLGADWWRYYLFLQIYSRWTSFGGVIQAWSLATEISFYLVIPLWAALVARFGRSASSAARVRVQLAGCAVLGLAGIASRVLIERWFPYQRGISFNWLPTNLDLFATGMALAVISAWAADNPGLRARLDRLAQPAAAWWAAAVALFAWYAYRVGPADLAEGYSGWFWHRRQFTLALLTALLLFPATFGDQHRGLVRRVWSWQPIVWLGTVSYGIYLWHFDWMKAAVSTPLRPGWDSALAGNANLMYLMAVGFGLGIGCAALSWYLLEKPLGRFKNLVADRSGAAAGAGSSTADPAR